MRVGGVGHLKIDVWKTTLLLGPGAFAVSFKEGNLWVVDGSQIIHKNIVLAFF